MIKKLLVLVLLFGMGTGSTYAFVVSAPLVESQLAILNAKTAASEMTRVQEFARTLAQWSKQYGQMVSQINQAKTDFERAKGEFNYWKTIKGEWKDVVQKIRNTASKDALMDGNWEKVPGMAASELYADSDTARAVGETVDKINKFMHAKEANQQVSGENVRGWVQEMVGQIPRSTNTGVSAMSQTAMEETMLFINKANKAIAEIQSEKTRIKKTLESQQATLTEAQTKSYDVAVNDLDKQMQDLNSQAMLKMLQLMVAESAMRTQSFNHSQQAKIDDSNRMKALASMLNFAPGTTGADDLGKPKAGSR